MKGDGNLSSKSKFVHYFWKILGYWDVFIVTWDCCETFWDSFGDESEGFGLGDSWDLACFYSGGSLDFKMNPLFLSIR